ncbi:hypothetical protein [Mucilaginibacter ginkgonis]|uniref:Uncharacterized protein n=1 Tax=Mucilaginibacter ginkgonis TaxID=2682091 RepID=A0A7T7JH47_9SPHI|nr:hypothetical protein [Mucilaginibacter ginkgonis]QQL50172.1 hypothetical protein GO620_001590 [Mucilaginibacter ginkgonis]
MVKREAKRISSCIKIPRIGNSASLSEKLISGFGYSIPPLLEHVTMYFLEKGSSILEIDRFLSCYQRTNWHTKRGYKIKDWKVVANEWIYNNRPSRSLV